MRESACWGNMTSDKSLRCYLSSYVTRPSSLDISADAGGVLRKGSSHQPMDNFFFFLFGPAAHRQ